MQDSCVSLGAQGKTWRSLGDILEFLDEAFGAEFAVWNPSAGENGGDRFAGAGSVERVLEQWTGSSQTLPAGPSVICLEERQHAVLLPVGTPQRQLFAIGLVESTDGRLLERLARMSLKSIEQRQQLRQYEVQHDEFLEQISQQLEEVSWLRKLCAEADDAAGQRDIADIAAATLVPLQNLVRAGCVALVAAPQGHPGSEASSGGPSAVLYRAGDESVGDDSLLQLALRYGRPAGSQPVVVNSLAYDIQFRRVSGLAACVVTPIAKADQQYGWLVVVNKLSVEDHTATNPLESPWNCSDSEFGTVEAGLISSAAGILASHARAIELFREKESLLVGVIRSLVNVIDAKDSYTCGHSDRVALISQRIARELGFDAAQCEQVYLAGLLHDIGKVGIPDEILQKPGPLTDEEFECVRKHPVIGYNVLKHLQQLEHVLPGVLYHHEAVDGSGYPHGLVATVIPLLARILAVADSYDAMTSDRPYRHGMSPEKAAGILRENAGQQWDLQVVEAFQRCIDDIESISAAPCNAVPTMDAWLDDSNEEPGSIPQDSSSTVLLGELL